MKAGTIKPVIADIPARLTLLIPGTKLLDLPGEVLTLLPTFFTAVEWAKGPSLTCRTLNRMQLPSLTLDLEVYTASKEKIPPLKYGVDPRPGWQMQAACDRREAAGKWAVQRGVRMEGSPYVFALTLDELEYAF
ncbi:g10070 [Coccomyxa viridis]|uniref:G10070 protein n=1 Tax=Coccomyxa viridis TaxID=1274662 RepID=A0ABP1G4V5_9CHLO